MTGGRGSVLSRVVDNVDRAEDDLLGIIVVPVPRAVAVLRLGAIPGDSASSAAIARTRRDGFIDLSRAFMVFSFLEFKPT